MSTEELLKQAKALAPAQKLELVEALLNELDRTDDRVDTAWAVEAADRLAAYRKGEIQAIPLAQVLAKYRVLSRLVCSRLRSANSMRRFPTTRHRSLAWATRFCWKRCACLI